MRGAAVVTLNFSVERLFFFVERLFFPVVPIPPNIDKKIGKNQKKQSIGSWSPKAQHELSCIDIVALHHGPVVNAWILAIGAPRFHKWMERIFMNEGMLYAHMYACDKT